jgi:glycogen debranching enzyme GlgX
MHRTGDVWHLSLGGLWPEARYAYRAKGPYDPETGHLYRFENRLLDPYAKAINTSPLWGDDQSTWLSIAAPLTVQRSIRRIDLQKQDWIIYEMHVRGFTQHPSSGVAHPGTYRGMIEKIPYLQKLGITVVELMPIFEFDETHSKYSSLNYWGYNPLSWMTPMRRFAHDANEAMGPVKEFCDLVDALHNAGIGVVLDVVYNHTGEGKEIDYVRSFRGIDNRLYYHLDTAGQYQDYAGCGNAICANNSHVQRLIIDSLKYWHEEIGVDGFRFDLASELTRGPDGHPMAHPPVIEAIGRAIPSAWLIAEPWDAAMLYQLGAFPKWGPWSEWNGRYRDAVRTFIKGTDHSAGAFATAISGSEPTYKTSHTPLSSLNFVTSHDGYTLADLVSYQAKHNLANGENNRDGENHNLSWHCGVEGPTNDPTILALRERQIRNFLIALFVSQGIPMLTMGDEYGHTRLGNNNPYVLDNEINWFNWNACVQNKAQIAFVQGLIAFRKAHTEFFARETFLTSRDVMWHGLEPNHPDWNSRFVAYGLKGTKQIYTSRDSKIGFGQREVYIAFNADFKAHTITLPADTKWREVVNTAHGWSHYFCTQGPVMPAQIEMIPHSALILNSV